jgi:hypothetical protein
MDTLNTQNSLTTDLLAKPNIYTMFLLINYAIHVVYQETLLVTPDGNFCADCCTCTLGSNNKKVKLTNDKDVFMNGSCNACK